MSATATATASDRSDFRTVMVGGTQIGVLTAAAVVAFLMVSRQVAAGMPQRVLEALIVLATGTAVSFLPARLTEARAARGDTSLVRAATPALVGAVALVAVARLARLDLVLPAEAGAGFTIALAALAVVALARKR